MIERLKQLFRREPKPVPFEPRNHLERLLVKASADAAVRPEFLRAFLDSPLSVIGRINDRDADDEGVVLARAGDTLALQHIEYEGRSVIPVFTSPERVADFAPGASYLTFTARDLLEMTGPQELLMNPGSAYGKHFLAEEVRSLLDGSAFRPSETWVAGKDEQMLIGRPANEPHRFVEALRAMFARRRDVRRAYIALIHIPSRSDKPNLLLALETDGDLAALAADCAIVARETLGADEYTDIGSTSIAADYFARDTPIYSRD